MQVTLGDYTTNPGLIIVAAALSSASRSTFEHASFTFNTQGIAHTASHHLVHHLARFTQQRQRYVPLKDYRYGTPSTISKSEAKIKYQKEEA